MQRTINGPDKEWLSLAEVAAFTTLSESTLRRLIDANRFPAPAVYAGRTKRWNWLDVVAWMHLAGRMPEAFAVEGDEEGEE